MIAHARRLLRIVLGASLLLALPTVGAALDEAGKEDCVDWKCAETMDEVKTIIEEASKSAGPENTLIVFDIDNTLLKMSKDLGSDAWYKWQSDLLKGPPSDFSVAKDVNGVINVQRLLYDLSAMSLPENSTPEVVGKLRKAGYPVMMLTGRGPDTLSATRRELAAKDYIPAERSPCSDNSCTLPPACGSVLCSTLGIISKEAVKAASEKAKKCFPRGDFDSLKRVMGYWDGVMMASGQNKGAVLQLLLASKADACEPDYTTHPQYKAVVFVDDDPDNTKAVYEAFKDEPVGYRRPIHAARQGRGSVQKQQ
jgi:hypothetical protein